MENFTPPAYLRGTSHHFADRVGAINALALEGGMEPATMLCVIRRDEDGTFTRYDISPRPIQPGQAEFRLQPGEAVFWRGGEYIIWATVKETGETAYMSGGKRFGTEYSWLKGRATKKLRLYTADEATRYTAWRACELLDLMDARFLRDDDGWLRGWRIAAA